MLKGKMTLMPGGNEMARILSSLDLAIQSEQVLVSHKYRSKLERYVYIVWIVRDFLVDHLQWAWTPSLFVYNFLRSTWRDGLLLAFHSTFGQSNVWIVHYVHWATKVSWDYRENLSSWPRECNYWILIGRFCTRHSGLHRWSWQKT